MSLNPRINNIPKISHYKLINLLFLSIPVISLFFIIFISQQQQQMQQSATEKEVQITVNQNSTGSIIGPDFLGLSIEAGSLCRLADPLRQTPVLTQLFKNLGTGTLRVGGGTVEGEKWSATGISTCSGPKIQIGQTTISTTVATPSLIDSVFSFAEKVHWKIVWGLNLENDADPTNDAQEAAYIMSHWREQTIAFELGNEPVFYKFKYPGFNYPAFKAKWELFATVIANQSPTAHFAGPAQGAWLDQFVPDEHTRLVAATSHIYFLDYPGATITKLFDPALLQNKIRSIHNQAVISSKYHIPLQIGETNSVSGGGKPDVSDTFASALWGLDYILAAAENGVSRMNFHGDPVKEERSPYSVIISDNNLNPYARPLYYALLLFQRYAEEGKIVPLQLNSSFNISAHAVVKKNGALNVFVINKEANTNVKLKINTTKNYLSASLLRLTAPSLATTIPTATQSSVLLGGSPVNIDGTWHPKSIETVNVNGKDSVVTLPAASALVISYSTNSLKPTFLPTPLPTTRTKKVPTITPDQNAMKLGLNLIFHGEGAGADNANPTANSLSNKNPRHPIQNAQVTIYNENNTLLSSGNGKVVYSSDSGSFKGTIRISHVENGMYRVEVSVPGHLKEIIPGIQTLSLGKENKLPTVGLITGDIDNDNSLNIKDYNLLLDCYSDVNSTPSCNGDKKLAADINDDGSVNQFDYNLFLREISKKTEQ